MDTNKKTREFYISEINRYLSYTRLDGLEFFYLFIKKAVTIWK